MPQQIVGTPARLSFNGRRLPSGGTLYDGKEVIMLGRDPQDSKRVMIQFDDDDGRHKLSMAQECVAPLPS